MAGGDIASYLVVGGGETSGVRIREEIYVDVLTGDLIKSSFAVGSVLFGEREVIISDGLAHELIIAIIDPYEGKWCFVEELGRKVRLSAKPQYW